MFAAVPKKREEKVKVGIVGEIYVKYSALGNNHLEEFLLSEDCEPVVPVLMDYVLYCVVNNINDGKLYGKKSLFITVNKILYSVLHRMQKNIIKIFKNSPFEPIHDFERNGGSRRNGNGKYSMRPALRLPAQPHCRQGRNPHAQKPV